MQNEELSQELVVLANKLNVAEQQLVKIKEEWKLEKNEYMQKVGVCLRYISLSD